MNPAKSFIIDINKTVNANDTDDTAEYPGMPVIGHLSYAYTEAGDDLDGEDAYSVTLNLGEMVKALNANWNADEAYAVTIESCILTDTEAVIVFSGVGPK